MTTPSPTPLPTGFTECLPAATPRTRPRLDSRDDRHRGQYGGEQGQVGRELDAPPFAQEAAKPPSLPLPRQLERAHQAPLDSLGASASGKGVDTSKQARSGATAARSMVRGRAGGTSTTHAAAASHGAAMTTSTVRKDIAVRGWRTRETRGKARTAPEGKEKLHRPLGSPPSAAARPDRPTSSTLLRSGFLDPAKTRPCRIGRVLPGAKVHLRSFGATPQPDTGRPRPVNARDDDHCRHCSHALATAANASPSAPLSCAQSRSPHTRVPVLACQRLLLRPARNLPGQWIKQRTGWGQRNPARRRSQTEVALGYKVPIRNNQAAFARSRGALLSTRARGLHSGLGTLRGRAARPTRTRLGRALGGRPRTRRPASRPRTGQR